VLWRRYIDVHVLWIVALSTRAWAAAQLDLGYMGPKRDAAISRQFLFVHHFCVSLDHFDFVLLVLLGLVFPVPSQEIGWEKRLRNDLYIG